MTGLDATDRVLAAGIHSRNRATAGSWAEHPAKKTVSLTYSYAAHRGPDTRAFVSER